MPVSDEVLAFLRRPLNTRIVSVAASWGLQGREMKDASGLHLIAPSPVAVPDLTEIQPGEDLEATMKAKIELRFA